MWSISRFGICWGRFAALRRLRQLATWDGVRFWGRERSGGHECFGCGECHDAMILGAALRPFAGKPARYEPSRHNG
jgi:hypothetical protein